MVSATIRQLTVVSDGDLSVTKELLRKVTQHPGVALMTG
jgi:hypothetical protein